MLWPGRTDHRVTRGSLFDTLVLEMKPPLPNGNRALVVDPDHVA
jgi:hypothetical protein